MLTIHRLAPLVLVLAATGTLLAQEPRPLENANQQLADSVAGELRASGLLRGYRIDVLAHQGTVELKGHVGSAGQRDEAGRLAQGVPGAQRVLNRLTVTNPGSVVRTQLETAQADKVQPEKKAPELVPPPRRSDGQLETQEPLPSFRAPLPPPTGTALPPPMPPYAWPSYAPYNNYSRVAYPVAYPNEAFPLIGPVYPFPKAPLGWHKVTLQFDDGHWWLQSHGGKRDWWVLRYW